MAKAAIAAADKKRQLKARIEELFGIEQQIDQSDTCNHVQNACFPEAVRRQKKTVNPPAARTTGEPKPQRIAYIQHTAVAMAQGRETPKMKQPKKQEQD